MNCEDTDQNDRDKNRKLYCFILITVPIIFIIYAGVILWLTWPISEFSINKSAGFGDSFGALTALFSGLAFSGMIVTILLQSSELKLQRKELRQNRLQYKRSAAAQEQSARLSALSTLLEEYKYRTKLNDEYLSKMTDQSTKPAESLYKENMEIIKKRGQIINELEQILHTDDKT